MVVAHDGATYSPLCKFTRRMRSYSQNGGETRPPSLKPASGHRLTWIHANLGAKGNGIFVAAKLAFSAISLTPDQSRGGAVSLVEFADWSMLACYFPQKSAKAPFFDVSLRAACSCADRPFLIIGDLNTGNQVLDRMPEGDRFYCAKQFDELSSVAGLVDLWRKSNGETREWTWWSRGNKNGFRLDHAFGNLKFLELYQPCCWYDNRPSKACFSDHSALLVSSSVHAQELSRQSKG
jgi:exonuclease III